MHSQAHSFCSMLVHGNTFHSGTPSLLRVPLLLLQQVDHAWDTLNEPFFSLSGAHSRSFLHFALPRTRSRVCFLNHPCCCCRCTLTGFLLLVHVIRCTLTDPLSSLLSAPSRNSFIVVGSFTDEVFVFLLSMSILSTILLLLCHVDPVDNSHHCCW